METVHVPEEGAGEGEGVVEGAGVAVGGGVVEGADGMEVVHCELQSEDIHGPDRSGWQPLTFEPSRQK